LSAARTASERLLEIERILGQPAAAAPDEPDADPVALHLSAVPLERIRQLTSLLQDGSADNDDVDAVAMRLLLNDYAAAVRHLRAVARLAADRVDAAAGPVRDSQLFLEREHELAVAGSPVPEPDAPREPGLSDPRPMPGWNRFYGTPERGSPERARLRQFEALTAPVALTWSDGLSIQIVPGDQLSRAVYLSGTYEPNTLCVLRSLLRAGDTLLDVGANVGPVALAASCWVGPTGAVYAIEPSQREFARLSENLERSKATNVTPVRAAVSSFVGTGSLRVAEASTGGLNTLGRGFAYAGVGTAELETVDVVTLDEFVRRHGIARVAAIKIDVEGSEGDALTGAAELLARDRPAVIIEVFERALQNTGWTVGRLEDLLTQARYSFFEIDEETAALRPLHSLADIAEQNVVALPNERKLDAISPLAAR
jgi:FkbM family methyltransferase